MPSWSDDWRPKGDARFFTDDGRGAVYDYSPAGALLLQHPKDDWFAEELRALVPQGFLTVAKKPFHWVIDEDYAEDVLDLVRARFDWVEHGGME